MLSLLCWDRCRHRRKCTGHYPSRKSCPPRTGRKLTAPLHWSAYRRHTAHILLDLQRTQSPLYKTGTFDYLLDPRTCQGRTIDTGSLYQFSQYTDQARMQCSLTFLRQSSSQAYMENKRCLTSRTFLPRTACNFSYRCSLLVHHHIRCIHFAPVCQCKCRLSKTDTDHLGLLQSTYPLGKAYTFQTSR